MNTKEPKENIIDLSDDLYEHCVVCGCLTNVKTSDPIELRKHYILGCGQLCEYCYLQLATSHSK